MPARLNILGGRREGQSLELDDGTYQVGTGRAADIQLRDKGVGFKHAALRVDGSTVTVVDFKSRGGTFVNEERIPPNTEVRLTHGDSLRVGTTPLEVILAKEGPGVLDPPEASPTPLALSEELGLPAEAPGAEDETPGAEAEAEEGTARTPPEPAPPSGPAVADAEAQN
ncbi:MAG: FHA domain-containing protein, partial [Planctomycetota bacterium]